MAPAAIVLVRPGAILKTSSGKLQRAACGDALRDGRLEAIAEWRPASAALRDDADWPAARLALDETAATGLERIAMLAGQWPPQSLDLAAPPAAYLDSLQSLELQHAIETHFARAAVHAAPCRAEPRRCSPRRCARARRPAGRRRRASAPRPSRRYRTGSARCG